MLEEFCGPVTALRLRTGLFGNQVDRFCARLVELQHRRSTIKTKLWVVGELARWMAERDKLIFDLDEPLVDDFLARRRRRLGRGHDRGFRETITVLLEHLRTEEIVPAPQIVVDDSPTATLLAEYEGYLRQERAVAACTVTGFLSFARALVEEQVGTEASSVNSLDADRVRDFLLARVRRMSPKRAQYMGSAVRSFLRFLFARGKTKVDLALAVPTVHQWRQATIPRHVPPEDVERILRACRPSSATGRRDHAVLLLLSRLGLRASEVVAIELEDLRWREGEIVVRGKGLVRDRLPLLSDVGQAIALYLKKDRPSCDSRRVFLRTRAPYRGFGHPSTVSTIVRRAIARAGLEPATHGAHLLRHSLATAMVRRGASFAEIGQVLRHRSPNTTEIYARLDFDALRDIAMPWPTARGAL